MNKPLIIFDIETTGLDVAMDRIVEFAGIKVDWETFDKIDEMGFLINPKKAISKEASDIHGIKYEDIKDAPTFKDVADDLVKWMDGCDLAGYNIVRFDLPLLLCEFERAGVAFSLENRALVDGYEIFAYFQPRTLAGALRFYCERDIDNAHEAMGDVLTTMSVLKAQLSHYDRVFRGVNAQGVADAIRDPSVIDLQAKLIWKGEFVAVNFGKHQGQHLKTLPKPYIKWMLNKQVVIDPKGKIHLDKALLNQFAKRKVKP